MIIMKCLVSTIFWPNLHILDLSCVISTSNKFFVSFQHEYATCAIICVAIVIEKTSDCWWSTENNLEKQSLLVIFAFLKDDWRF